MPLCTPLRFFTSLYATLRYLTVFTRVVIRGTSSKKSQRDFVPSTHPGTHELVLSTEKHKQWYVSKHFINIYFFISRMLQNPAMVVCGLCRYDLTPLADRIGPWNMHGANMIVKER